MTFVGGSDSRWKKKHRNDLMQKSSYHLMHVYVKKHMNLWF